MVGGIGGIAFAKNVLGGDTCRSWGEKRRRRRGWWVEGLMKVRG